MTDKQEIGLVKRLEQWESHEDKTVTGFEWVPFEIISVGKDGKKEKAGMQLITSNYSVESIPKGCGIYFVVLNQNGRKITRRFFMMRWVPNENM